MSSSQGKLTNTEAIGQEVLTVTPAHAELHSDRQQIFELMDGLLSFEACLYHQILPWRLEDKNLLLGMVHPQDSEALEYVNRILSYINCTMVIEAIAVDVHRTMLSAYLNYKNTFQPDAQQEHQSRVEFINESVNNTPTSAVNTDSEEHPEIQPNQGLQADFPASSVDSLSETATLFNPFHKSKEQETSKTALLGDVTTLPAQVPNTLSPIEVLPTLPPKKLLEELLGRVLAGGIGRLYLERQPYQGRILWSDNGVLQSVIENLPLSVLQGVLNELKKFADLPVITITEPKQVEKEYLYQQNRLLLRLRVMPGMYGEEATLQVLRGAALKFYQQQQLGHVSRDALGIAQQLNLKLHELQQRLVLNPNLQSEQLDALIALNKLMENIDQQIKTLTESTQASHSIK
ncbi:MAG: pilus assembly protein PilB [Goleter apudmare HA4340-LM2]|jgi:type II secretory ATPase GspE/PulE/Tfp pilus assembly ATPase PilB-like protein|nr:pilus assembly protein PilB [Goleter apudmare HA4340-LM2]